MRLWIWWGEKLEISRLTSSLQRRTKLALFPLQSIAKSFWKPNLNLLEKSRRNVPLSPQGKQHRFESTRVLKLSKISTQKLHWSRWGYQAASTDSIMVVTACSSYALLSWCSIFHRTSPHVSRIEPKPTLFCPITRENWVRLGRRRYLLRARRFHLHEDLALGLYVILGFLSARLALGSSWIFVGARGP